jgi:hypothetical protein
VLAQKQSVPGRSITAVSIRYRGVSAFDEANGIRLALFEVIEASAAMLADSESFQILDSEWKALEWRLT